MLHQWPRGPTLSSESMAGRRFPLAFQAIQAGHGGFLQPWAELVLGLGQAPADPTAAPETEGPEAWLRGLLKRQITRSTGSIDHFIVGQMKLSLSCLQGPPLPCYPNGLFLSFIEVWNDVRIGRCEWCRRFALHYSSRPKRLDQETELESMGSPRQTSLQMVCHEHQLYLDVEVTV